MLSMREVMVNPPPMLIADASTAVAARPCTHIHKNEMTHIQKNKISSSLDCGDGWALWGFCFQCTICSKLTAKRCCGESIFNKTLKLPFALPL